MPFNPLIHHRRSIRFRGYDYSAPGAYFVTIDTHRMKCLFGKIKNGVMILNPCGQIVSDFWSAIPTHYPNVQLDDFIVMPNHIHGIIMINDIAVGRETAGATQWVAPTNPRPTLAPNSIGSIVGQFKSAATKKIIKSHIMPMPRIWQRNYHEHIIRSSDELRRIRKYIRDNPLRWDAEKSNQ